MKTVLVSIDYENNAETWWRTVGYRFPRVFRMLSKWDARRGATRLPVDVVRNLESLPGWSDGPAHAKTPLVVVE